MKKAGMEIYIQMRNGWWGTEVRWPLALCWKMRKKEKKTKIERENGAKKRNKKKYIENERKVNDNNWNRNEVTKDKFPPHFSESFKNFVKSSVA